MLKFLMYFERYLNFMKWKSSLDETESKNAAKVSNEAKWAAEHAVLAAQRVELLSRLEKLKV